MGLAINHSRRRAPGHRSASPCSVLGSAGTVGWYRSESLVLLALTQGFFRLLLPLGERKQKGWWGGCLDMHGDGHGVKAKCTEQGLGDPREHVTYPSCAIAV